MTTPDRWRRVEELYHAALTRSEGERARFLTNACAGDEDLRSEVELMLRQRASAEHVLAGQALSAAVQPFGDMSPLVPGRRLGAYEIQAGIGVGGMGEVYRARDTKLGRDVAIKVISRAFTGDPDRLARFEREARVLASLNHPHIGAIYGIEESAGLRALVLELVEGETLAQRLASGPVATKNALAIAGQVADALDAAHERGIVHRDLKPANIKITPDGVVKVLDFGLAKAVSGETADVTESSTVTVLGTRQGMLLGTAAYMSPEQARGQAVDKRTDIWAFGCVLYEMLTGRAVFARATLPDTLAAVVESEPDWEALPPSTPTSIRQLLRRCLDKSAKRRIRDIGDVRFVFEDSEVGARDEVRPANSSRIRLTRSAIALLLLAAAAAGWWIWRRDAAAAAAVPANRVSLVPLTTDPGYDGEPTFAPDGETVAYVSDRTGNFDIFLRQASGGRDINLTNDSADDVQPAFSPDGRQIAFVSSRLGGSAIQWVGADFPLLGGGIWVMPALGGSARRVAEQGNFPAWSPDGSTIIYTAGSWFGKKIYRVPAVGGTPEEIPITLRPTQHWMYASYSPDGRSIVFEAAQNDIYIAAAEGGVPTQVARGHHPLWSPDGYIVYSSTEAGRNYSLWRVPISLDQRVATGPGEPITISRGRDLPGSISRDGKRIAFTGQEQTFNLHVMPFDAEAGRPLGPPEPLTRGSQLILFLTSSPDGQSFVFDSQRGASSHIWRVDRGSTQQALTTDDTFDDRFPRWSPDGRSVLFNRRFSTSIEPSYDLWQMAADGGNPRVLIKGLVNGQTAWAADSGHVVYYARGQLMRVDVTTGESVQLTNEPGVMPIMVMSPDDRWVVYQSTQGGGVDLRAVPADGGQSMLVAATPQDDYHPSFSPSGRWLYFQPGHKNLVRVPGAAQNWRQQPPEQVTQFQESGLLLEDVQPTRDGRQLAFSRGQLTGDIWILTVQDR